MVGGHKRKEKKEKQPPGIDRRPYPTHTHTISATANTACLKVELGGGGFLSCLNIDFFPAEVTRSLSSLSTRLDLTECVTWDLIILSIWHLHRWAERDGSQRRVPPRAATAHRAAAVQKRALVNNTHSFFILFYFIGMKKKLLDYLHNLQWRNFFFFPCVMRPFK